MTTLFTLQTIFEIILVAAVIWGAFNEEKLARFEKRIISNIRRRRLKVIKTSRCTYKAS